MKSAIVVAALAVAVVSGLVLGQQAHADWACGERYESLTLELVGVTVDGEAQSTLDEYEGREFLLQTGDWSWRFLVLHEERVEVIRVGQVDETDEEVGQDEEIP